MNYLDTARRRRAYDRCSLCSQGRPARRRRPAARGAGEVSGWWKWWMPFVVVFLIPVAPAAGALWLEIRQAIGARELFNQITGGESFVYLEPLRQSTAVRYFIRHSGEHPAYDVILRVQEIVMVEGRKK